MTRKHIYLDPLRLSASVPVAVVAAVGGGGDVVAAVADDAVQDGVAVEVHPDSGVSCGDHCAWDEDVRRVRSEGEAKSGPNLDRAEKCRDTETLRQHIRKPRSR